MSDSSRFTSFVGENQSQSKPDFRMPNAAWAWEHLRRNPDYQRDYRRSRAGRQRPVKLSTGATLIRERRRWLDAEKWGLLAFADPEKPALNADVFWSPELLAGTLPVRLYPIKDENSAANNQHDEIVLSTIPTRRVLLETADGARHMLMSGQRFWVQLFCENPASLGDSGCVGLKIDGTKYYKRRLDTADQLLSLYQSTGGKLSLIGRRKDTTRLTHGLIANDIMRSGGSHRDVATAIYGAKLIGKEWGSPGRYYEDWTRRLVNRVHNLVDEGYKEFLTKKTL
jgi:hypothetical protein